MLHNSKLTVPANEPFKYSEPHRDGQHGSLLTLSPANLSSGGIGRVQWAFVLRFTLSPEAMSNSAFCHRSRLSSLAKSEQMFAGENGNFHAGPFFHDFTNVVPSVHISVRTRIAQGFTTDSGFCVLLESVDTLSRFLPVSKAPHSHKSTYSRTVIELRPRCVSCVGTTARIQPLFPAAANRVTRNQLNSPWATEFSQNL